jgi:diguanylate cyclase (GGDEF)-like protein
MPYGRAGLLSLDIDRFRAIDQSLGHVAGDEVILEVSLRLRSAIDAWLESHDVEVSIARSGRDEFLVLVEGTRSADETAAFAQALYTALLPPVSVKGQTIRLAVSGGLVESMRPISAADMMRNAELTTRRAKALGGGHWLWFNDDMHLRALERLKMESDLGSGIENNEFRLLYQPIFELETRRVLGFEALLRWQRTPDNLEQPVNFIGVAEETGHIVLIGAWLIREACRSLAELQRAFPREPPLFVSINVSPRQFRHETLANQFREAIAENLIAAESVHLEVTESITIDDVEKTASTLQTLRSVGVRCGIDDFGTGYSSLNYLHELPFDTLKIDRSFVARLGEVGKSREIVRTLVGLARHLRMQVVVEGIETEFQLATLTEMGCQMGQGFLLSRPLKFDAAVEMLSLSSRLFQPPA